VRVALDTSPLAQTRAGTARHVRGLLGALAGRDGVDVDELAYDRGGRAGTLARDTWWYLERLPRAARGSDVLHCTTFRGPLRSRPPLVVTLHDLAFLRHPETFPAWHRVSGRALAGPVARRADAVVAVSEFTKWEAVELLEVPAERIRVVPNGVEPVFVPDGPAEPGEYALAVGTLEPRKNLARAVEAARIAGVELRVVGAAVLVDPFDAESIAAGIHEAERRRDELRAAGLERARHYTWGRAADAIADLWRELA
jgi:glycosyltransferase involved in cell wall biosynthesis